MTSYLKKHFIVKYDTRRCRKKSNTIKDQWSKIFTLINKEKRGIVILIRDTGRSIINNLITNQSNTNNTTQKQNDELRIYGMGAQILSEIGVKKMILLTNTEWKFIGIEAFDIEIIETQFLNIIDDKKI